MAGTRIPHANGHVLGPWDPGCLQGLGRVPKGVKEAGVNPQGWSRTAMSCTSSKDSDILTLPFHNGPGFDSELKGAPGFGISVGSLGAFCTY